VRIGCTLEDLAKQQFEVPRGAQTAASADANKIAIIGFSGRFPEADDLDEFWDLLMKGLDVHKPIPEERFGLDHYDPTGQRKNTSQVQYGCWLKTAGHFDTQFFHMSPKEAMQTDPAQRLALLTAYEALEMAGLVPDRTPSTQRNRIGVYYGTTSNDWGEVNSSQDVDTYYIPGANRAFIPGRVNYFFKFTGPSIAVDTACSSSLAAINLAITSLMNRDCDTAIAGGTNVMTNPDNFAGLDRGHFLSRTGNCNAFDDGADGYCRADGIGTLVLKRLPDAIADNDPVFGIILGAQTNHSAESVSITRPLADAQEYLFKKLLNETGVHPHDVSYVEMHGTGTQAGDAVEMRSVLNSFAFDYSRPRDKRLYLGSVKANVGHAESASGVIAVIKVLLMMQKNKIPPHCGIKTKINRNFPTDLDSRGVHIALGRDADWHRPVNSKRRVLINNFSAAGGNTSLLLEDGDGPDHHHSATADPRTEHVVVVSARSTKALEENLRRLEAFVANSWAPEGEFLSQLSYTSTARRMHHSRRVAFVTNSLDDLRRSLFAAATVASDVKSVPAVAPKVGFLFTGQGAQETAMAHGYYKHFSSFRSDIHELDRVATVQGLPSMLPLVEGTVPVEGLSPVVVQLGTCIIQIALARFWISLGVRPHYFMGHSLGEYAALQLSGVLSVHDAIYLCGHRAALLERKCTASTHGMVAVKAAANVLRSQIPADMLVEVACINGTQDTVLSGPNAEIDALCAKLAQLGYKFHKLDVPYAFHSSQVDPILGELEELASRVTFRDPVVPIVSTLLGTTVSARELGPQYIRRHCRETVDFVGAVQTAEAEGLMDRTGGVCVEIGATPILTRMVKSIIGQDIRCCASLRRKEDFFRTLADSLCLLHLAGVPINWDDYHRDFASCRKVLTLPWYSWQLSNYWMQYKYSWCLTKGDAPAAAARSGIAAPVQQARAAIRLSDSVHDVVEQSVGDKKSSITAQSDMHDPALLAIAQNHRVNGLAMAPSVSPTSLRAHLF
jgi:naphtho-gamma-pyrone polyketide synthase